MDAAPVMSFAIIGIAVLALLLIVGVIIVVAVVAASSGKRDRRGE
jgi:hypothetical protein